MQQNKDDVNKKPLYPISTGLKHHGSLHKKVEAVLFDIYGTLFISGSGDISIAEKEGKKTCELDNLFKKFSVKESTETVLKKFYSEIEHTHMRLKAAGVDYPEVKIDEVWQEVLGFDNLKKIRDFATLYENSVNPVFPMPHLQTLLAFCKKRQLPMGIISNAQFFTPLLFNVYLNTDPISLGFDPNLMFLSYKFGYAKPSLYLFQKAISQLALNNITPDSTIYIGNDMLNDIYPAYETGFQTVLFAGDKRSLRVRKEDPRCINIEPDLVITNLLQLMDHII